MLIACAGAIAQRVLPGGVLVLSGVLAEQRDPVVDAYEREGLRLVSARRSAGQLLDALEGKDYVPRL